MVFERGFFVFCEDFDEVWDVDDDEVLECGLENPDYCESCQWCQKKESNVEALNQSQN